MDKRQWYEIKAQAGALLTRELLVAFAIVGGILAVTVTHALLEMVSVVVAS